MFSFSINSFSNSFFLFKIAKLKSLVSFCLFLLWLFFNSTNLFSFSTPELLILFLYSLIIFKKKFISSWEGEYLQWFAFYISYVFDDLSILYKDDNCNLNNIVYFYYLDVSGILLLFYCLLLSNDFYHFLSCLIRHLLHKVILQFSQK